jgi:hypothetical protein
MTKSQELFLEEATSLYKVLSMTEKRISDFTFVPVVMKCLPWLTQGARVQLSNFLWIRLDFETTNYPKSFIQPGERGIHEGEDSTLHSGTTPLRLILFWDAVYR